NTGSRCRRGRVRGSASRSSSSTTRCARPSRSCWRRWGPGTWSWPRNSPTAGSRCSSTRRRRTWRGASRSPGAARSATPPWGSSCRALDIGGMGAKGKNFYNELARRYGYEDEAEQIQNLYLDGKKDEAAAAVPDELVRSISLIGPRSYVAERIEAFREAGATTLTITPLAPDAAARVRLVEQLRDL